MAFNAGYKTRILLGDFSLSAKMASISLPRTVDMHDVTVYADNGVKRFIPGLGSSTATMSGFYDESGHADAAAWTTATPLTYAPYGLTAGSKVELIDAVRATFEVGNTVSGATSFDLSAETDGYTDYGISLHDLEAETGDEDGTSVDNSASSANGGVGHLHVTAYSGLTNAVIKVQDSTDDAVWDDLITFSTVTAVTGQRSEVTGTVNRYVRYSVDVTGTGSVTFQVSFARR